jgi:NAD-reducing hydrogenase small subunit
MKPVQLATLGLSGCSGCLMSLLDSDGWLADLAAGADIVHGPLVDTKEWPTALDICLVEGAVGNAADLQQLQAARRGSRLLVACGDCAVTGNVPALHNACRAGHAAAVRPQDSLPPALLPRVRPLHACVNVDRFLPGCPPSPQQFQYLLAPWLKLPAPAGPRAHFG